MTYPPLREPRDRSGDEDTSPRCPYCIYPREIRDQYPDGSFGYLETCGNPVCLRAADAALDVISAAMETALRAAQTLESAVRAVDDARDAAADIGEDEPESPADEAWAHLRVGAPPWMENDADLEPFAWNDTHVVAGVWPDVTVMTRRQFNHVHSEGDICASCNGSGEGGYDGSRCGACRGRG